MIPEIPETWVLAYFTEAIDDHVLTYTCRCCGCHYHFTHHTPYATVAEHLRWHLWSGVCFPRRSDNPGDT